MRSMFEKFGHFELELIHDCYPKLLKETRRPPHVLYGYGNKDILSGGLAVVGARRATPYGLGCAAMFAARAAALGITIVSGGAIGCDQEAARAALEQHTPTVVVLAGGADIVYPASARELFEQILASGGALVSEQTWGSPALRPHFVERNRIIAGLAKATLIVEAGLPSGTFSTADAALNAGREVLAVPGSIHSRESRGCNRLILQGALPVVDLESFDDTLCAIFNVFPLRFGKSSEENKAGGLSDEKARIVSALAANPMHLDELSRHLKVGRVQFLSLVSECEAFGLIERYRDGRYGVPVMRKGSVQKHRSV